MHPADFKRWRKSLSLSQKEAANALGLKRRMVQYYEKGERDGDAVIIPMSVRLACYAIAQGVTDYQGPEEDTVAKAKAKSKAKQAKGKQKDRAKPERKSKKERGPKKSEDSSVPQGTEAAIGNAANDKRKASSDTNGAPPSPTTKAPRAASKPLTSSRPAAVRPKPTGTTRAKTTVARSRKPDGGKPPAS